MPGTSGTGEIMEGIAGTVLEAKGMQASYNWGEKCCNICLQYQDICGY